MGGVQAVDVQRRGAAAPRRAGATKATKRLLTVAVLGLTAAVVVANRHELPAAWRALRHVRMWWFGLALLLALAGLADIAAEHAATRQAVGLPPRLRLMLPLAAGSRFLNLVAKSGGFAGMGLFRAAARRSGEPEGQVTAAYLLAVVLDPMGFGVVLAAALVVLIRQGRFTAAYASASVVFAAILVVTFSGIAVAIHSRAAVRAVFQLPRRIGARVRRGSSGHEVTGAPPDHTRADEFYDAVVTVRRHGWSLWRPGLAAFAVDVLGVAQLWAVLRAVGVHCGLSVPLVAYAVSTLFGIVGLVPGGLGLVEVSLGAALVSFDVGVGVAGAAVVLYRAVELWIPLAIGAVAARQLTRAPRDASP